jgi:hypothetical protein
MACQCGCCDIPAPAEGTEAPETVGTKEQLERELEELDRRVKELESAA